MKKILITGVNTAGMARLMSNAVGRRVWDCEQLEFCYREKALT